MELIEGSRSGTSTAARIRRKLGKFGLQRSCSNMPECVLFNTSMCVCICTNKKVNININIYIYIYYTYAYLFIISHTEPGHV